jgi:hypothetical protein
VSPAPTPLHPGRHSESRSPSHAPPPDSQVTSEGKSSSDDAPSSQDVGPSQHHDNAKSEEIVEEEEVVAEEEDVAAEAASRKHLEDMAAEPPTFSQGAENSAADVLVLISEVWGGFSLEAMRFLGKLAQARNDGIDIERASTTWSTSSFTSYHGQLLSLAVAVQWGVAIEIERAIKKLALLHIFDPCG